MSISDYLGGYNGGALSGLAQQQYNWYSIGQTEYHYPVYEKTPRNAPEEPKTKNQKPFTFIDGGVKMKLQLYKKLIKMAKDKVDEAMAPARAHRAKKQAELEIAKMEEQIASGEARITELCAEKDIDFHRIIGAPDDLALTERKKKQFEKILDEMFPDD